MLTSVLHNFDFETLVLAAHWSSPIPSISMFTAPQEGVGQRILIAYETVRYWGAPARPIKKDELEVWHLGQFVADAHTATGKYAAPFGFKKGEHPDFELFLSSDGSQRNTMEFAAFTLQARRAVEAKIGRVRERIYAQPSRFEHLAGCHAWLLDESGPEQKSLKSALRRPDLVAESLASMERPATPDPALFANGRPQQMPQNCFTQTVVQKSATLTCCEYLRLEQAKGDPVWRVPRVDPSFTIALSASEVLAELAAIIDGHDYAGVDVLTISAGGPDRFGAGFVEDETLLRFGLDKGGELKDLVRTPERKVVVHWWDDGKIERILPNREEISGSLPYHQRNFPYLSRDRRTSVLAATLPPGLITVERTDIS
jgi:hypothetical protein